MGKRGWPFTVAPQTSKVTVLKELRYGKAWTPQLNMQQIKNSLAQLSVNLWKTDGM